MDSLEKYTMLILQKSIKWLFSPFYAIIVYNLVMFEVNLIMMRRVIAFALAFALIFTAVPQALAATGALDGFAADGSFAAGEALVLCEASYLQQLMPRRAMLAAAASANNDIQILDAWNLDYSTRLFAMLPDADSNADSNADSAADEPLFILRLSSPMDTTELVAYLDAQSGVIAAEPNYAYSAQAVNDPYFNSQWGLSGTYGVHPESLTQWESGSANEYIVAVVDTGIDYNSPDLAGRIREDLAFDAYPSARPGTDTGAQGHGTHVAGIIAAATNNGTGVAGVTGVVDCKIMPVRVFNGSVSYSSDVVAGIGHIIQSKLAGNNIVAANMSIGGKWFSSEIMRYALSRLADNDILPVRSAGNDSLYIDDNSVYPSFFETPYVTAVAAIDSNGSFDSSYSNYSPTCVQVAAPGTSILSTWFAGRGGYISPLDTFENDNSYNITYAAYKYGVGVNPASASSLSATPTSYGYQSPKSLQFEVTPFAGSSDIRVTLPNSLGQAAADGSLGVWVRFTSATPLPDAYSLTAGVGSSADRPYSAMRSCALDQWYYMSAAMTAAQELSLWISIYSGQTVTVCIDDLGSAPTASTGYNVFEGTSMAAPFFTGAYALLRAAYPSTTMAELRARLIGGSRPHNSLTDRVNSGGSVDLREAVKTDTLGFAPVIDTIEQSGNTVTVKGWFFGASPTVTLGSQTISAFTQTGTDGGCTISFELPSGVGGVQTLTVTKSNGRSYRMRYDYSPRGNMTELGTLPAASKAILHDVFSYGNSLYYLISTADGFEICVYENGVASAFIPISSAGDRAARDDFSCFVQDNVLYVYDYNHIHRFDMASKTWLPDIPSPYTLDSAASFYTGAVAVYNGRLMLIGGMGSSADNHIRVYDDSTASWSSGEVIDSGFTLHAARAVNVDGKLVVFAMYSYYGRKEYAVFVYDGQSWSKRACPYTDLCGCSLSALDGEALCFGDSGAQNGILAYNVASDSWRRIPYYGSGLSHTARGTVSGRRVYAITGQPRSYSQMLQFVDIPVVPTPTPTPYVPPYIAPASILPARTPATSPVITRQGDAFIVTSADFSNAVSLSLSGTPLTAGRDYSLSGGALCLSPSLLARLGDGRYVLYAVFPNGSGVCEFELVNGCITDTSQALPPATGDADSNAGSAALLMLLAPVCLAAWLIKAKRKRLR